MPQCVAEDCNIKDGFWGEIFENSEHFESTFLFDVWLLMVVKTKPFKHLKALLCQIIDVKVKLSLPSEGARAKGFQTSSLIFCFPSLMFLFPTLLLNFPPVSFYFLSLTFLYSSPPYFFYSLPSFTHPFPPILVPLLLFSFPFSPFLSFFPLFFSSPQFFCLLFDFPPIMVGGGDTEEYAPLGSILIFFITVLSWFGPKTITYLNLYNNDELLPLREIKRRIITLLVYNP